MLLASRLFHGLAVLAAASVASAQAPAAPTRTEIPKPEVISLPDGEAGIGYDDLQYASTLKQVIVPAGRTGRLILIDPATRALTSIEGFSSQAKFGGGHGEGTTSAIEGDGFLFATDRGTKELKVVDPAKMSVVASTKLSGGPDYVRFVAGAHELWVTEPSRKQVEIFKVDPARPGKLAATGSVSLPDGPESLVIDARRGRAYAHSWKDETYAVDLKKRAVVATWKNGCSGARGGALDEERGFLFVGCGEGKIVVIDVASGKTLSSRDVGSGIDSIGYGAALGHLYVPAGDSADLTVLAVSATGELTPLGKVATGEDAHTVAIDAARSNLFVGNPAHGQVLVIHDPFPGEQPRDAR